MSNLDNSKTESHMLNLIRRRYTSSNPRTLDSHVFATQVPLVSANRRIDAIALSATNVPLVERRFYHDRYSTADTSPSSAPPLDIHGFEVKVSRSDWLAELRTDGEKSAPWRSLCSHWWMVVPEASIIKPDELPEGWGVLTGTKRLSIHTPAERTFREPMPYEVMLMITRYALRLQRTNRSGKTS